MNRRGFTLAELLLVLGITGVVAAVILPAINGLMPDKTKINYLKVYDEVGKNLKALAADSSLYPIMLKNGSEDIDVSKIPLLNNSQPLKAPFKDNTKYSGDKKLCNLMAFSMGVEGSNICTNTSYPTSPSYTTSNGMQWWISENKRDINTSEGKVSYQTDIYVDIDSSKNSPDCMYGEESCNNKTPDRFKFLVSADGTLYPADPVGMHYLNTRKNLLKKKFKPEGDVLASLNENLLKQDYNKFLDKEQDTTQNNQTESENNSGNNDNNSYSSSNPPDKIVCGETIIDNKLVNCYRTVTSSPYTSNSDITISLSKPSTSNLYFVAKASYGSAEIYRLCIVRAGLSELVCGPEDNEDVLNFYDNFYEYYKDPANYWFTGFVELTEYAYDDSQYYIRTYDSEKWLILKSWSSIRSELESCDYMKSRIKDLLFKYSDLMEFTPEVQQKLKDVLDKEFK